MKLATYLTLLGSALGVREELPPKCASEEVTDELCHREMTFKGIDFWYWVTLEDKIPTLHGHFDIPKTKSRVDGKSRTFVELRICFEIGVKDQLYKWREQIQFHSNLKPKKGDPVVFDTPVQTLDKNFDKNTEARLKEAIAFCQYNKKDGTSSRNKVEIPWITDGEITIDFQQIAEENAEGVKQKDHVFLDFQRPLIEKSANSMDLQAGKDYEVFVSYYIGKDIDKSSSTKSKVQAELDLESEDKKHPKFQTMTLNKLKGLPEEGAEGKVYTVKASATKNMITWGTLAIAATASVSAMY